MEVYKRTFEENEKRLIEIVALKKEGKHQKEARKKAEFWSKIVSGKNQDDLVLEFRPKETSEQKKVRLKAYNPATPYLVEKIKTIYAEADRSNKVVDKIEIKDDENGAKLEKFNDFASCYFQMYSPREYINMNFLDKVAVDQNAYEVIEYEVDADGVINAIYPVHYPSEQVVEDNYFNGWLQYVVFKKEVEVEMNRGGKEKTDKFILYAPDYKIKAIKVLEDQKETYEVYNSQFKRGYFIEAQFNNDKPVRVFVEYFETRSKRVPAIKIGFTKCPLNPELYESILRPAKSIFRDNIQKKANFDTILKAHGIYRTFARVPRCTYRSKETGVTCNNGYLVDGQKCPACQGTGKTKVHNTDLDLITFPLDNDVDPKERINLQDMVYTEKVDTTLMDLYERQVDKSEKQASLAIFNTNIFDRKELLAGTATEIRAQFKNVNNKLFKYEEAKSRIVRFICKQIAIYAEIDEGFDIKTMVPSDFELETLEDLLEILQKSKDSGAPQHLINDLNTKIFKLQHEDEPQIVREIQAFEIFKPFHDLPESERVSIVTLLEENDPVRIRYVYYSEIVKKIKYSEELKYLGEKGEEVTIKDLRFYELPYEIQDAVFEYYASKYYEDEEDESDVDVEDEEDEEEFE